jgi:nucleotide-binding universal stress UspA family protein
VTTVIGLAPGERGGAAVHLGAMLARSTAEDVVVAAVVPRPWPPNPYREDAEYLAYQESAARQALIEAQSQLGEDLSVRGVLRQARSVSSGLLEVAREHEARVVALGSSAAGGLGVVSLGGVAQRILYSSEIPVTLAPKGFTVSPGARVTRITVAFGRSDGDSDLLRTAARTAQEIGATLRVACFAVRPMTASTGSIEASADELVVEEWVRALDTDIGRALRASDTGTVTTKADLVVGQGGSWGEALADVPWASGDVLAVGTSSSPVSRIFLGSHASKIVRSASVPVFLMPRMLPLI